MVSLLITGILWLVLHKSLVIATTSFPLNDNGDDNLFCAVMNPLTGTYIDLSPLSGKPNGGAKGLATAQTPRWNAYAWDLNTTFTLSVCGSAVGHDAEKNTTGAYYKNSKGAVVSVGQFSTRPKYAGGKLTLKYEQGDTCSNGDRAATLLNFVCDHEISAKAQVLYIGQLNNCSYLFEVRSVHACPTASKTSDVHVVGIFVGILFVFALVEYVRRRWLRQEAPPHWPDFQRGYRDPVLFRISRGVVRWCSQVVQSLWALFFQRSRRPTIPQLDVEHQNDILDALDVSSISQ